jgi:hypothetical protein
MQFVLFSAATKDAHNRDGSSVTNQKVLTLQKGDVRWQNKVTVGTVMINMITR